ncbi:MAG: class I SAM-dependent methyltransferase [Candidatus Bathyarchaeota archaeon]|nr:class I SAM-dependent methyltransferase [Candidatus Bathyarchaeota archaeon]
MTSRDFMLKGIDIRGLVIMDAGTGAANTTLWLASKLKEVGGGRIISIDNDPETFLDARRKLGELAGLVEFVEADLTCMPQIESESVDLIVCHATFCAVNNRPLKAVKALSEFYRTLKKGGWLIIEDEFPLPRASKPEEEVQVKRWQIYKSIAELVDGEHYTEIYPEELEFAGKLVGFKDIELRKFEGEPLSEDVMSEWREAMFKLINKIDDENLKQAFHKTTERIWRAYKEQGGIFPPYYTMRMRK